MEAPQERILIIDDEPGMREGCRRILEPHGYFVQAVASAAEGLALLREKPFDLVLLDLMLRETETSGIELIHQIHAIDPDLVCIVITDYATIELAVEAIREGAYDFIAKPFDSDRLLLAVRQGLERRRLTCEARRLAQLEAERERLQELERIKSAFTLIVAHELRAPVAAIQSYLRLILDGYIPPERQRAILEKAERRARAQLDLIADLLDLARLQNPDIEIEKQKIDFVRVLHEVLDEVEAQRQEKNLQLDREIAPGPLYVWINQRHARQLWLNLISNAIKYTPAGGRIRVSLHPENDHIVGIVQDTGIGIPPEEQEKVFLEFYRSQQAKQIEQLGTGLGLPIVKRILETYGGSISLDSEPGKGSTFTFTLPLAQAEPN